MAYMVSFHLFVQERLIDYPVIQAFPQETEKKLFLFRVRMHRIATAETVLAEQPTPQAAHQPQPGGSSSAMAKAPAVIPPLQTWFQLETVRVNQP